MVSEQLWHLSSGVKMMRKKIRGKNDDTKTFSTLNSTYLQSLDWSSGLLGRIRPFLHLEHKRVLAFVANSSGDLHRSHEHQKNFDSCRCWRRFKVPCGGYKRCYNILVCCHCVSIYLRISYSRYLHRISVAKGDGFALLYHTCASNGERMTHWIVGVIRAWHTIVTQ